MSEKEKRPITLEDVEKHLNQQDERVRRGNCFAVMIVGFSVVLVALGLWVGNVCPPSIVPWYCGVLILWGLGLMVWGLRRMR